MLYFLLVRFDVDLAVTWANIRQANPFLFLLAFGVYYLSFPVRGARWRVLAGNSGLGREQGERLPSSFTFSQLVLIGWFGNAIGWLRMGDALRGYLLANEARASFSKSMGTLLAERVVDLVAVAILLTVTGTFIWAGKVDLTMAIIVGAALVLVGVALLGLLGMALLGERLGQRLPGPLRRWYLNFHAGTLGSFQRVPLLSALSLVGWLVEGGRLYFILASLGLEVAPAMVLFIALATSLLTTVPWPGGVGLVEAGVTGLFLLSFPIDTAVSVTLLDRSVSYLSVVLFGGLLFAVRQTRQRNASREARPLRASSSGSRERQQ
ncbi:MAG: flippase-like domain-containing protein [Chloroflexi bacterium]|nr:flippase-like domain-containing protein [Chloroflexota bacterium]